MKFKKQYQISEPFFFPAASQRKTNEDDKETFALDENDPKFKKQLKNISDR